MMRYAHTTYLNLRDYLSILVFGHSYRWLKWQREHLAQMKREREIKDRN